mgnify:CR=1 FL=1
MKLSTIRRVLLLLVTLACGLHAPAQTPADQRLGELLNGGISSAFGRSIRS